MYVVASGLLIVVGYLAGSAQYAYQYCGSVSANCGLETGNRGAQWACAALALGLLITGTCEYRLARRRGDLGSPHR